MKTYLLFLLVCACALVAALGASGQTEPEPEPIPVPVEPATAAEPDGEPDVASRELQKVLDRYRRETWRWQRVMGRPVTVTLAHPPKELSARVSVWKRIAVRTRAQALHPPHEAGWRCIHHFEGAWHDPSPPYYGGLQMEIGFQSTYGHALLRRKGTADRWTPLEQMWVAERAHRAGRGFFPWPNTARACGLL